MRSSQPQGKHGGQAGVIANQMAALGARSLVYTSLLSQKQVDMFFLAVQVPVVDNGLKVVPVGEAVNPSHQTKSTGFLSILRMLSTTSAARL